MRLRTSPNMFALAYVIPAKAGTQHSCKNVRSSARTLPRAFFRWDWVPAFAGMTARRAGMTILLSGYGGL